MAREGPKMAVLGVLALVVLFWASLVRCDSDHLGIATAISGLHIRESPENYFKAAADSCIFLR